MDRQLATCVPSTIHPTSIRQGYLITAGQLVNGSSRAQRTHQIIPDFKAKNTCLHNHHCSVLGVAIHPDSGIKKTIRKKIMNQFGIKAFIVFRWNQIKKKHKNQAKPKYPCRQVIWQGAVLSIRRFVDRLWMYGNVRLFI